MYGYVPVLRINEIITADDPIIERFCFKKAIVQETRNLKKKRCFLEMEKLEVPSSANVLSCCVVLNIKNDGTSREREQARLVAQVRNDNEKPFIIQNSVSL